jgi:hypothetical protein
MVSGISQASFASGSIIFWGLSYALDAVEKKQKLRKDAQK